jgi:pantothenate kinase type III
MGIPAWWTISSKEMKVELAEINGSDKPITVVATGGFAEMISKDLDCIEHVDKLLTLGRPVHHL